MNDEDRKPGEIMDATLKAIVGHSYGVNYVYVDPATKKPCLKHKWVRNDPTWDGYGGFYWCKVCGLPQ